MENTPPDMDMTHLEILLLNYYVKCIHHVTLYPNTRLETTARSDPQVHTMW